MRTTLNIDDELVKRATRLTGAAEKTELVRLGLEVLIARASADDWPTWAAASPC